MTPTEYADAYQNGAKLLRDAVQGMTREQLVARPVPGKWSTLEVVAHLADFDTVLSDRILLIAAAEKPTLQAADENDFAAHLGYQERDLGEELAVIDAVRAKTARVIRGLKSEQLARTGMHPVRGELTLERIIQMATKHIPNHIKFIEDKRKALGL